MIKYMKGDLFSSPAQVVVNTVNLDGVMGKGIALQFKKALSRYLHERIRAYKKIGYIVSSGMDESIQDGRSVYVHEGYVEMLRKDLEKARSDVVLCTTGLLADSFWMFLEELKEHGITITVFSKEKISKKIPTV